jgi:hypothetical protein
MSIRDDLSKKCGPLPVWAWLLTVCGGVAMLSMVGTGLMVWLVLAQMPRPEVADGAPVVLPAGPVSGDSAATTSKSEPTRVTKANRTPVKLNEAGPAQEAVAAKAEVLPVVSIDQIAAAYQADRDAAEAKYKGKRLRVEITARKSGDGWIGTVAQLTTPQIRRMSAAEANREAQLAVSRGWVPNVVFHVRDGKVDDHKRAVIEGTCAGIAPDYSTGLKLTFTEGRIIGP